MAATQAEGPKRVSDSAIIHTTMGDIHIKLFPVEYVHHVTFALKVCLTLYSNNKMCFSVFRCPKTVENFCVHSRNGYYNGHIFHRVIKVSVLVSLARNIQAMIGRLTRVFVARRAS